MAKAAPKPKKEPKRARGRPPIEQDPSDEQLHLRIHAVHHEQLRKWCKKNKWSKTEAVLEGLRKIGAIE